MIVAPDGGRVVDQWTAVAEAARLGDRGVVEQDVETVRVRLHRARGRRRERLGLPGAGGDLPTVASGRSGPGRPGEGPVTLVRRGTSGGVRPRRG